MEGAEYRRAESVPDSRKRSTEPTKETIPVGIKITIHKIEWNPQKSSIGHQKNTAEASAGACFIVIRFFL